MLAKISVDATHRFQPFQPSSVLVGKVDQPTQPTKNGFLFFFPIENEKTLATRPTENGWSE